MRVSPYLEQVAYLYLHWCPGCGRTHGIAVNPPDSSPSWQFNGNVEKPTFNPSVRVGKGSGADPFSKCCHYFIREGRIEYCSDSDHELAGQTIDLPPLPNDDTIYD